MRMIQRGKKQVPKFDDRQYILNMIADNGPMTANQLWEKLENAHLPKFGEIKTKSKMKYVLQHLSDRNLIRARPNEKGKSFTYHVIRNFFIRRDPPESHDKDQTGVSAETTSSPSEGSVGASA
eukprot:CAMPEP_0197295458 /NCGR_PEP_ID=MMETSP0890-20130614/35603_1 /TAXON_ID=44058 ORGANISM="Aureoumbra lagunensis, Strain CCMP1510" /NCGR_SAMPLE_ID=MMETSP0890 /ASSEMBLY_ACC=CAM_ASM_000533 /LENGTH=122 /DNA_ID=CAMNT_0042771469 /DNA_START=1 /DNA_END=369 /DNA_ORIENTATION=+